MGPMHDERARPLRGPPRQDVVWLAAEWRGTRLLNPGSVGEAGHEGGSASFVGAYS